MSSQPKWGLAESRNVRPVVEPLEPRQLRSASPTLFVQHNLESDLPGKADHVDKNLVNPWGLSADDHGPLWVADNGTSVSTLYAFNTGKKVPLTVKIPGGGGQPSAPTGTVYNQDGTGFVVKEGAKSAPADFLFAGEDGGITAWSGKVDPNNAKLEVDNSGGGAVYKGLAQDNAGGKWYVYATDFVNGKVDVYDSGFRKVTKFGTFTDPQLQGKGYTPFGIQNLGGKLYVTYAKTQAGSHDEAHGAGFGFVDVFSSSGRLIQRLSHGNYLNAPWGLAKAPATFGSFAGDTLVGNFGSGNITAFDSSGNEVGQLKDAGGHPIQIDGLWGLRVGNDPQTNGTLFFAAGINDEADGLLGKINAL